MVSCKTLCVRVVYKKVYAKAVLGMGKFSKRVVDARRIAVVCLPRFVATACRKAFMQMHYRSSYTESPPTSRRAHTAP